MCGIAGIIIKQYHQSATEVALNMSRAIKHRGPDGEGLLAISENYICAYKTSETEKFNSNSTPYIPKQEYKEPTNCFAAFAHRRLAIIDLNDTGHQPMCDKGECVWITYNGEIYNYKELKEELKILGYAFASESDTEVVINAYKEWGTDCVTHFNGMWAFCIYDKISNTFFASRDRLGVKPLYYIHNFNFFAFASEQKAFIKSGLIKAIFNKRALHSYLVDEELENCTSNFFEGITELWPGQNLVFDPKEHSVDLSFYFERKKIETTSNDKLSNTELIERVQKELFKAVQLRMRSDVEVGTCLSGGIDSSVIAGIMAHHVKTPIHCFTSVFKTGAVNEEKYADLVSKNIKAKHSKTEPNVSEFEKDIDDLIYALDAPIWDTSTYAQFRVMRLAKENRIKVVLDGQGADELFAGYHHHYISKWDQTLRENGPLCWLRAVSGSGKSIKSPFAFLTKQKIKQYFPGTTQDHFKLLKQEFIDLYPIKNANAFETNLNKQLITDLGYKRLKSFLRCEDRCGMWHSVESRTPFSDDVNLIELMFSFNGKRKIHNGLSKYFLREAAKDVLPKDIYERTDKVGFETPMKAWVIELLPKMLIDIEQANFEFMDLTLFKSVFNKNKMSHIKMLFKLFVLARWQKVFS
ncbi:MAG: asparagine synthase (glutamine-hydrolyzing) [Bacteroidota bacterium]|nr:asparagine synthase (glutamine-hydrolyzing) [Bacteroidota bacterium]